MRSGEKGGGGGGGGHQGTWVWTELYATHVCSSLFPWLGVAQRMEDTAEKVQRVIQPETDQR